MALVKIPARHSSPEEDCFNQVNVCLSFLEYLIDKLDIDLEILADELGIPDQYQSPLDICSIQMEENNVWTIAKYNSDISNSVSDKLVQSLQELRDRLMLIASKVNCHEHLIDAILDDL